MNSCNGHSYKRTFASQVYIASCILYCIIYKEMKNALSVFYLSPFLWVFQMPKHRILIIQRIPVSPHSASKRSCITFFLIWMPFLATNKCAVTENKSTHFHSFYFWYFKKMIETYEGGNNHLSNVCSPGGNNLLLTFFWCWKALVMNVSLRLWKLLFIMSKDVPLWMWKSFDTFLALGW